MTELLTQEQVELRMYYGGIKRAETMMAKAEEKGRAVTNPYAKEVLDDYVIPVSRAVAAELEVKRVGVRQAHASLLRGLDPDAVALLAVRTALNHIMGEGAEATHRSVAYAIGKTVHSELVLVQIEEHNPDLYHTLARDLGRRLSKDERHRMTVFKMQAVRAGIMVVEWPVGAREQVGMYLLGLLEVAGMIEIEAERIERGKRAPRQVFLTPLLMDRINEVKSFVAITMPVYGPCVAPPRDWTNTTDGGFYTRELRRAHPCLIRHRLARTPLYRDAQMPIVLEAVNALQRTAWQVNTQVLDAALKVAAHFSVGDITSLADAPKPAAPAWLQDPGAKEARESWPADRQEEFKKWKRTMATWYTDRKLLATKYGRFYSATRAAEMFRDYPAIHFVYFADSRGRLYPMTYGLNPQGSDLQRALIRFSKGMPVTTPDAIKWFHVQGANKWGFDKATLEERQQWVIERQEMIRSFAEDPVNNSGWRDADSPLQFLAWCFEYREWLEDRTGSFVSRIPISMDGSCNGLQNLSALLRDEIGGEATNLTANAKMQDIYNRVALATIKRLETTSYDDTVSESLRERWLTHGVSRSVVKRSVMTTPYGVTRRSAADYVVKDYLYTGAAPVFDRKEYQKAASILMDSAWPAIGDVVVKGREAMDWLRRSARCILKSFKEEDEPVISWVSPSGFPAAQSYFEVEVHRINTRLHGPTKIRVLSETDEADLNRHANGLAPNFVHSMDAAHLHLTTSQAARRAIDALAMIHDDYGTHAANAQELYHIIREQFVAMYEQHDPIQEFADRYPMVPTPPTKGGLDIRQVLESRFFFS